MANDTYLKPDHSKPKKLDALLKRTLAMHNTLLANYDGGDGMPSSTRGREREQFITEVLSRIYPSHFRFGSGAVIDSFGTISGQIDIIINSPYGPSFPLTDSERLFLVDVVAGAISVKSNMSKGWLEIEAELEKAAKLKKNKSPAVVFTMSEESPYIPYFLAGYDGIQNPESLAEKLERIEHRGLVKAAICLKSYSLCIWSDDSRSYINTRGEDALLRFIIAMHYSISTFQFGDNLWKYAVHAQVNSDLTVK